MLETTIDPWSSTNLLTPIGHGFVWWTTFLGTLFALVAILQAWMTATSRETSGFTEVTRRRIRWSLFLLAVYVALTILFIAFTISLVNPVIDLIILILFALLLPCLILLWVAFIYFGVTLLVSLKKFDFAGNRAKEELVRKTTYLMFFNLFGSFLLLSLMVLVEIYPLLYPYSFETFAFILVVKIGFDFLLLFMNASIFATLSFKNFGNLLHAATSKSSSENRSEHKLERKRDISGKDSEIDV